MKFSINQQDLLLASQRSNSIVESKGARGYDIQEYVLIEAAEGMVQLRSVAAESTHVVAKAPAEVEQPGSILVPSGVLNTVAQRVPAGTSMSFETAEEDEVHRLRIIADKATFNLETREAEEFPQFPDEKFDAEFQVSGGDLASLFEKTHRSVSEEETRYYLTGIYLHTPEDDSSQLIAVATDGHRLSKAAMPAPDSSADAPGIILPKRTVDAVRQNLPKETSDGPTIAIGVSENRIRFQWEMFQLVSPVIDGTYPDYARVIPDSNDIIIKFPKKELAQHIEVITAVSGSNENELVVFDLKSGGKSGGATAELSLRAQTGDSLDAMDIEFTGKNTKFSMNAKYLRDLIAQIDGDEVEMRMKDATSAFVIHESRDPMQMTYVIMPHRI